MEQPLVCDSCRLTIPAGNAVFDVAVSSQTVLYDADGENNLDFDPQYEVVLCTECWAKVKGLPTGS
jgi:hypothetical protein